MSNVIGVYSCKHAVMEFINRKTQLPYCWQEALIVVSLKMTSALRQFSEDKPVIIEADEADEDGSYVTYFRAS